MRTIIPSLVLCCAMMLAVALPAGSTIIVPQPLNNRNGRPQVEYYRAGDDGTRPDTNDQADAPAANPALAAVEVPILMYHRITPHPSAELDISVHAFEQHLQLLAQAGYTTISMAALTEARYHPELLPAKPIVITFDDGYRNQYRYAAPLLEQYGFRGTFYIYTDIISVGGGFMTWDQLGELAARGHEIGAHSLSHPYLTGRRCKLSSSEVNEEIAACKQRLEEHLGIPITTFAYPYGFYSPAVLSAVRAAGYRSAVTTNPGPNNLYRVNSCTLQRYNINHTVTPALLLSYLSQRALPITFGTVANGDALAADHAELGFMLGNTAAPLNNLHLTISGHTSPAETNPQTGMVTFRLDRQLGHRVHTATISGRTADGITYTYSFLIRVTG